MGVFFGLLMKNNMGRMKVGILERRLIGLALRGYFCLIEKVNIVVLFGYRRYLMLMIAPYVSSKLERSCIDSWRWRKYSVRCTGKVNAKN